MNNQIKHLKAKITQLTREKEQLRLFLHELIEAFYKTVNKGTKETSTTWTFDPKKFFQALNNLNSNQSDSNQANECAFNFFKDFFSHTKVKKEAYD